MRYINWILPLKIKNLLKHFLKKDVSILKETEKNNNPILERNKELNDSVGENKACYILACGPSINEMDLSKLIGEDCISVSNFFVHPLYNQIQPKYHVFAPHHFPISDSQYLEWIVDHESKTKFDQSIFIHKQYDKLIKQSLSSTSLKKIFFENIDKLPEKFNEIKLDNQTPHYQTVVHLALYLAIGLGYKEIYLLGIDHNWLLNFGKSMHFYQENQSVLSRSGYDEYYNLDLEDEFHAHAKLWAFYKSIKKYSIANNIKIYNSTPNSFLDVFEFKLI
jgi:hypothetical protein